MTKMSILMTAASLSAATMCSHAAFLGTYDFDRGETSVPEVKGFEFGVLMREGLKERGEKGRFGSSAWSSDERMDEAQYIQFTITPTSGTLTFDSLSFHIAISKDNGKGNLGGPDKLLVRISANGFKDADAAEPQAWSGLQGTRQTLTFDPKEEIGSENGFTIRIYGWGAEKEGGTLSFDDVAFNGSITPVPEPVSVGLLAFGCGVVGVWSGRRWIRRQMLW